MLSFLLLFIFLSPGLRWELMLEECRLLKCLSSWIRLMLSCYCSNPNTETELTVGGGFVVPLVCSSLPRVLCFYNWFKLYRQIWAFCYSELTLKSQESALLSLNTSVSTCVSSDSGYTWVLMWVVQVSQNQKVICRHNLTNELRRRTLMCHVGLHASSSKQRTTSSHQLSSCLSLSTS